MRVIKQLALMHTRAMTPVETLGTQYTGGVGTNKTTLHTDSLMWLSLPSSNVTNIGDVTDVSSHFDGDRGSVTVVQTTPTRL